MAYMEKNTKRQKQPRPIRIEFKDKQTGRVIPLGRAIWDGKRYVYEALPKLKIGRLRNRRLNAIQARLASVLSRA